MDRLEAMSMLVKVAQAGSLSSASRSMNVPLATLSRKVADLEALLGARLLIRTTRQLTLTDAGSAYVAAARRILDQVEEAEREAVGEFIAPKGELVMTAPLNEEERALLTKILQSVKIASFEHIESDSLQIGILPDGTKADHVLIFIDAPSGREFYANSPWWIMPAVNQMIGANAAVVAKKKETWNWLQAFAKER